MGLRDIESTLPPGFRFCPSDEELVFHYLYKKVTNSEKVTEPTLMAVNLHTCEPSELPDAAKLNENEWYFFSFRERKYSTGFRSNRAAKKGYWKATGKDRTVQEPSRRPLVGMRKTLVFYNGRAPNGVKSGWVMHEFRLENPYEPSKEDWVLCRVFQKTRGAGTSEAATTNCAHSEQTTNYNTVAGPSSSYLINTAPTRSSSSFPLRLVDVGGADGYGQQQTTNSLDALYHHGRRPDDAACSAISGLQNSAMWQYGFPYPADQEADSPTVDGGEAYKLFLDMGEPEEHDLMGTRGHEQLNGGMSRLRGGDHVDSCT